MNEIKKAEVNFAANLETSFTFELVDFYLNIM